MSAQPMESQMTCEMDVFTPQRCSLDRDSSMMSYVTGNKAVPGHCFSLIPKNTELKPVFLSLSFKKKFHRSSLHNLFTYYCICA